MTGCPDCSARERRPAHAVPHRGAFIETAATVTIGALRRAFAPRPTAMQMFHSDMAAMLGAVYGAAEPPPVDWYARHRDDYAAGDDAELERMLLGPPQRTRARRRDRARPRELLIVFALLAATWAMMAAVMLVTGVM